MELCLPAVRSTPSILSGAMPPCCVELSFHTVGSYASLLQGGLISVFLAYGVTVSGLPKVPFFTVFSLVPPPESFVLTSI